MLGRLFSPFRPAIAGNFTAGEKCSGCNFKHDCFKCGSPHPAGKCALPRQQPNPSVPVHITQRQQTNQPLSPALSRQMSTPIKADKLQAYLDGYLPRSKQYLLDGFRFGFSIDYVGPRNNFSSKNLSCALDLPEGVNDKLAKELHPGRIAGPFETQPFPIFHIFSLGLIHKEVPGKFHMIRHLSFPDAQSVNSHIPKIVSSVDYASITLLL